MASGRTFWNLISDFYAKQALVDTSAYERKLLATQKHLTKESHVLEVGCGTGSTALRHAPFVKQIEAIDYADKMITLAQQKQDAAGVANIRFSVADATNPPFAEGQFDAVLALNLIHLLNDPNAALRRYHQLIKPGGVLVVSTMPLRDMAGWLRFIRPILPFQLSFFDAKGHAEDIVSAGFDVLEQWTPAPKAATFVIARKPA